MANVVGSLVVNLTARTAAFAEGLRRSSSQLTAFSSRVAGTMAAAARRISGVVAMLTGGSLIYGALRAAKAAETQMQAEAKLAAILKSTGNAAGLTANELIRMAGALQRVTNFGDETTISAMALLATFKNIKGDIFKDAIVQAQNISTILGTDLKSSILQLGKALNDPKVGLTYLNRAGITFSETQKQMIYKLVESNKLLDAQALMLKEVGSQFDGAAKAAASPTTQIKNMLGDIGETIGKDLIPYLDILKGNLEDTFGTGADGASSMSNNFSGLKTTIDNLADAGWTVGQSFMWVGGVLQQTLSILVDIVSRTAKLASYLPGGKLLNAPAAGYTKAWAEELWEKGEKQRKDAFAGGLPSERAAELAAERERKRIEAESRIADAKAKADELARIAKITPMPLGTQDKWGSWIADRALLGNSIDDVFGRLNEGLRETKKTATISPAITAAPFMTAGSRELWNMLATRGTEQQATIDEQRRQTQLLQEIRDKEGVELEVGAIL